MEPAGAARGRGTDELCTELVAGIAAEADGPLHTVVDRLRTWLRGPGAGPEQVLARRWSEQCVVELDDVGAGSGAGRPDATAARLSGTFSCARAAALRGEPGTVATAPATGATEASTPLTRRELEVLSTMATGRTRGAAARTLGVSVRTVDKHLEHINEKLGTSSLVGALRAGRAARR